MLFTKSIIMIFTFNLSINFSKSALTNRYNINNINEFLKQFHRIAYSLMMRFTKMSVMLQLLIKNNIQLIIQSAIFLTKITNQFNMIHHGKNIATSMFNNVIILFVSVFHMLCICSMKSFRAVFVDLCGRAFIYETNNHS